MGGILDDLKSGLNSLLDRVAGDDDGPVPNLTTAQIRQKLEARAAARKGDAVGAAHAIAKRASSKKAARQARVRIARKREARFHKRQQERAAKTTREQNAAFEEAKRQAAREGAGMGGSSRASGARARARRAKDAVFGEDKKIAGYYKQFNLKYGAPFPEVKAAFRKMMRKYHPDMHSQSPGKQKAAAELTRKLNIAYDALERHLGEKMIETKASRTAMMVAGYRARATDRDDGICKDPWAAALAGEEGLALSKKFDRHFAHMELWMAVRTAYLDAHVSHWTGEHGFGQVVILGAGMDTRAARLAADGVTFFEVDHPATQAYKRERLAELDGYPVDAATYTSCNFETEDFLDRLVAEGFDAGAPAIIVWEGVVPYLTQEAVRGTLSRIASGCDPRTVVTFDYLMKRMAEGIDLPDRDVETRAMVEDLGEPVQFGINEPVDLLHDCGFAHVRSISFNEATLSFGGGYDRERMFRFQHIALASRTVYTVL